MNVEDRLRDALSTRADQYDVDVEDALRTHQAARMAGNPHGQGATAAILRHRFVAIVAAAAAVAVIAAGIPIAAHLIGDRDQRAVTPPATETPTAAPSPTSSPSPSASTSPSASALKTASPSPSASTSPPLNGVGATPAAPAVASTIFVEHEVAYGIANSTKLESIERRSLSGALLGSYAIAGEPHEFDLSPDGKFLAYMRSDGVHVANARDGSNDHIVHAVPSAASQDCIGGCADGYTSFIRWSYDDAELAIVAAGSLWIMSADGSSIREIVQDKTSSQQRADLSQFSDKGGIGVLDVRWSPTSQALVVTFVGDETVLPAGKTVSLPIPQYGQFVVSVDGLQDQVLPREPTDLVWTPDGSALALVDSSGVAHRVAVSAEMASGRAVVLPFSRGEWAPDGLANTTGQWSPDGARYVWVETNGSGSGGTAVVYPATGGAGYQLPGHFVGWVDSRRVLVETEPSDAIARLAVVDVVARTKQSIGDVPITTSAGLGNTDQFAIG